MMLISSFMAPAFAQAQDDASTLPDTLPDIALLEYLAELVEVDGELVGPLDMAAATDETKKDKHEQGEKSKAKREDKPTKQPKNLSTTQSTAQPTAKEDKSND